MPRSLDTFSTLTHFFHCFKVANLCLTLSTSGTIHQKWWFETTSTLFFKKNLTVRTLGKYSKVRTVHIFCSLCMEFGLLTLSSDTDKVLEKIWKSRTSLLMNKIFISENALTKWYLLGSIEFLATLKCLIIICCFLPADFWQKYAEVSELTGYVWTSGNYGNNSRQPALPQTKCSEGCCISVSRWESAIACWHAYKSEPGNTEGRQQETCKNFADTSSCMCKVPVVLYFLCYLFKLWV